jgi:hypothetical protein
MLKENLYNLAGTARQFLPPTVAVLETTKFSQHRGELKVSQVNQTAASVAPQERGDILIYALVHPLRWSSD